MGRFRGLYKQTPGGDHGWPLPLGMVALDEARSVAMLTCPCGCGRALTLNLREDIKPRWRVSFDAEGLATISPSVQWIEGCMAHFFIRAGAVEWC